MDLVDANKLLGVSMLCETHEPRPLVGRALRRVGKAVDVTSSRHEQLTEATARPVGSDHAAADDPDAQGSQRRGYGGGPARPVLLADNFQYWHGGFGADALGVADQVSVEQKITDHQHSQAVEGVQQVY
jgi:hypothetical protein